MHLASLDRPVYVVGTMRTLLIVPLLLLSLSGGMYDFVGDPGADRAATSHQAPSPAAPVDVAERQSDLPAPCGMENCIDMVGCTGAGSAVGAHAADLPTWTVAAPDDPPLVLAFQTATRTAVPPPPRT